MEGELKCARDILTYIHDLYNIAVSPSSEPSREQTFYKRDIVPVFTPYARHMYTSYEFDVTTTHQDSTYDAVSGSGEQ